MLANPPNHQQLLAGSQAHLCLTEAPVLPSQAVHGAAIFFNSLLPNVDVFKFDQTIASNKYWGSDTTK